MDLRSTLFFLIGLFAVVDCDFDAPKPVKQKRRPPTIIRKQMFIVDVDDSGQLSDIGPDWNNTLREDPFPLILENTPVRGIAVLTPQFSSVRGTIVFEQTDLNAPVNITGTIVGLGVNGAHGLHVHSLGDLSNGCSSTGGHLNPQNLVHGGPKDIFRHAGDLGNIQADENGEVVLSFTDSGISLGGMNSVLGRAVVLHALPDDLGQANTTDSHSTGSAGPRIACGIIGLQAPVV